MSFAGRTASKERPALSTFQPWKRSRTSSKHSSLRYSMGNKPWTIPPSQRCGRISPSAPASKPVVLEPEPDGPKTDASADTGTGSYLRVAVEQMEELSDSMHQLLAELQADEGIDETLRQIELEIRGLRRGWDQLHAQVNALSSAAQARQGRNGPSIAPRLRDFDQGLKALFRGLSALSRDRR